MNLAAYTATALSRNDITDTPTNKNIVDGAIVELKDLDGNLVVIYDDSAGANPETQKSCDTNGQLTFWAEVGDYSLEVNGSISFITIGASVKFTRQSRQAIEATYKAQGYNNVFFFEDGFTYVESNDVGIYEDGTAWTYADSGALPVDIDAGTVPSEGVYRNISVVGQLKNVDDVSSLIKVPATDGSVLITTSYHPGWAATNTPPRGGNSYTVVSASNYALIRNQQTSVLGFLDFSLNNGLIALADTRNLSLYQFGGKADYTGSAPWGTDNTPAIESALTFAVETGCSLDFSTYNDGGFYQASPIDLSAVTPSNAALFLTIKGDKSRTDNPSWIMNDVADVGVDLPNKLGITLERIALTTNGNGKTSATGKVGIRAATNATSFRFTHNYVSVSEFSGAGFEYHDCLVSDVVGGNIVNNKVGYKFDLTFFAGLASTTINWRGTYVINNDVGIDGYKVSESLFQGVVFENNRVGMVNVSGIKNTFIGCYGENNAEYAYVDLSGASAAFINCFNKTAGDNFVCTGDTGGYGFDRVGSGYYDDRKTVTQKISFYDRSGNDAEGISCQNSTGEMQLLDSSGNKLGKIPTTRTNGIPAGDTRREQFSFMLYDGALVGNQYLPSGWSASKNSTGSYDVLFDAAIRPPFFQVSASPLSGNAVTAGQKNIDVYPRVKDSGGSWVSSQNATGLNFITLEGGTPIDAAIFVSIEVSL